MNLNGYIKQSYKRPNRQVLESLGANERLIEYLMETPGNTNMQVVEAIGGSGSEIELPYTFHCEKVNFEGIGEDWTILEKEKWTNIIDSINGGGHIIGATFNLKTQEQETSMTLYQLGFTYIKNIEEAGQYAGAKIYTSLAGSEGDSLDIEILNVPAEELFRDYYIINGSGFDAADELNIVLDKQEGYVINIKYPEQASEAAVMEKNGLMIKKGESLHISYIGYSVTDGVNTYTVDDVITPTSDMELTIIKLNGGNQ